MTTEQKQTYRQHVKQNIEKCIELVGSKGLLSIAIGYSVNTIDSWMNCKTGIKHEDYMYVLDTTAQLERERIERIEVTYETVKPRRL